MEPGLLKSADWPVLIDLYFFLGGIAGGAFVIATIANLLGHERYRDIVRVGYYIAFLAVIPGPIILTVDLGLPTRFLHMLMVAKPSLEIGRDAVTVGPFHLKPFSPMNAGAWALLAFSACAFLAALDVFLEHRGGRSMRTFRGVVGVIGTFFGFFLAAYPGVLIGATARPLFVSAHCLGALFLAVGASTGSAAIALILSVLGATGARRSRGSCGSPRSRWSSSSPPSRCSSCRSPRRALQGSPARWRSSSPDRTASRSGSARSSSVFWCRWRSTSAASPGRRRRL